MDCGVVLEQFVVMAQCSGQFVHLNRTEPTTWGNVFGHIRMAAGLLRIAQKEAENRTEGLQYISAPGNGT